MKPFSEGEPGSIGYELRYAIFIPVLGIKWYKVLNLFCPVYVYEGCSSLKLNKPPDFIAFSGPIETYDLVVSSLFSSIWHLDKDPIIGFVLPVLHVVIIPLTYRGYNLSYPI